MGAGLNEVTYEQVLEITLDNLNRQLNSAFLDPQARTDLFIEKARVEQELKDLKNAKDDKTEDGKQIR